MSGLIEDTTFLHVVISLGILLFTAKIFAEIFHRFKLPVVLGELLAGIVVGPFALGTFLHFDGKPIVALDETIKQIGELSAIVILFIAGLEITPREFLKGRSWTYCCRGKNNLGCFIQRYLYCDNNYGCPYNSCNPYLAEKSISKGENPRTCLTSF